MANVGILVEYEIVLNRSTYSSRPVHKDQFAKLVEKKLYSYPIWKISYKQCQFHEIIGSKLNFSVGKIKFHFNVAICKISTYLNSG